MPFIRLKRPLYFKFSHVKLMNIYQSSTGKMHYYGVIQCDDSELLRQTNESIQKNIRSCVPMSHIFHMKFPTHYNKPLYKARTKDNMPTVAEALKDSMNNFLVVDVIVKIDGYIIEEDNVHYVFQCSELYECE